nr:MAG TPA: hypothetical protein [Caudoviricetes sp.]
MIGFIFYPCNRENIFRTNFSVIVFFNIIYTIL